MAATETMLNEETREQIDAWHDVLSDDEDIAADDLLDYKDQLKVESFNSESLYQILEDELGSTKTLIQDQDVNSTQAGFTGPLIITTVRHSG